MITKVLPIGMYEVTAKPAMLTCIGLGSCIGLFVIDKERGISGAAHIPIPSSAESCLYPGASRIIAEMLDRFASLGSSRERLSSKVVGGAHLFSIPMHIGLQTAKEVVTELTRKNIDIVAADIGGSEGRTARFNTRTGELQITTAEKKSYFI